MIFAQIDQNNNVIAYPVYEGEIRTTLPNTSFPHLFEENLPEGYVKVEYVQQPTISLYQNVEKAALPSLVNGTWQEVWIITEKSEIEKQAIFEDQKIDKVNQINNYRNQLEQNGFSFAGKILDSDPISVQRLTVASMAAQAALASSQPFSVNWVCKDNTILVMDASTLLGALPTLAIYATTLHEKAMVLKLNVYSNIVYPDYTALEAFDVVGVWNAN